MNAGFLSVVENGQYFMTKDTGDLSQFHAVACREYTLPREEGASQPKGWIQGNTKIGPVLEVATCCLHGKYGVEIRIMSVNKDHSHSWVRISHGSNKFVMYLNNNETEIRGVPLEEYALKLDAKDFACRSKAKAKPQRREPAGSSPRTVPVGRELGNQGNIHSPIMKYRRKWCILFVIHNMCIEKKMEPFNSGELKKIFRNISCIALIGLIASGKHAWQEEEEKGYISSALIFEEQLFISELFKDIHDAVSLILLYRRQCHYSEQLLPVHLSCRMCNQFAFHHQFWINTWRSKFEQQTNSVLFACGSYAQKSQGSDRLECIASCTIPAQSMEKTSRRSVLV